MKISTYIPGGGFPRLAIGQSIPVYHQVDDDLIGDAVVIDMDDKNYIFELTVDRDIDETLYPSISQSSTNGIIKNPPRLTLSRNSSEGHAKSIAEQNSSK